MVSNLPTLNEEDDSYKYIQKWQDVIAALPPPEMGAAKTMVLVVRAIAIK